MRPFVWIGILSGILLVASPAQAQTTVTVAQESAPGAGDFASNVLGTITTYTTSLTASAFYAYANEEYNGFANGTGAPAIPADGAALFLVEASDGLALFAVYDRTSSGPQTTVTFQYTVLTSAFATPLVVTDDASDTYTFASGNTTLTNAAQMGTGKTDGFVARFTGPTPTLTASLTAQNGRVVSWTALSSVPAQNRALSLTPNRRVMLSTTTRQAPTRDVAGWRLLSVPVNGTSVAHLAAINLVQGVPAGTTNPQQYPNALPNLFYRYDGTLILQDRNGNDSTAYVYQPAPHTDYTFAPGQGFWWYWYDLAFNPSGSGQGTSVSRDLSDPAAALVYSGVPPTANVSVPFAQNPHGFYMTGNPFARPFAVSGISSSAGVVQTVASTWDPQSNSHVQLFFSNPGTGQPDYAAVWQGLLSEITDGAGNPVPAAPTVTYAYASTSATASPIFYGLTGSASATTGGVPHVHFRLAGTTTTGATTLDESTWLRFLPDAALGWDQHDASKLLPFNSPYALIAPLVGDRRLAVSSLPDGSAGPLPRRLDLPVAFIATAPGTYTLSWDGAVLPAGWRAFLLDLTTGTRVQMWKTSRYTFSASAGDWETRFVVRLRPAALSAALEDLAALDAGETAPALGLPQPNPATGQTRVTLDLDVAQPVRVRVVDALGREVAVVRDGQMEAGVHTLVIPVQRLGPGTYVLRVEGETLAESRRFTVVR